MSVVMFNGSSPEQPASMIDRLMAETLTLAEDAKSYIENRPKRRADAAPLPVLAETTEISRVTTRVSHCMAWLLARKAVNAGEIGEQQARGEEWRLTDHDVCEHTPDHGVPLPSPLQHLSDRSLALFERIARLDRQLDTQH